MLNVELICQVRDYMAVARVRELKLDWQEIQRKLQIRALAEESSVPSLSQGPN